MATTATVPLSEYPDTIYHPDRKYVDGAVLERNAGKNEQARAKDYLEIGMPAIWVIDPTTKTGRTGVDNKWKQLNRLEVPATPVYVELDRLFERMVRTSPL